MKVKLPNIVWDLDDSEEEVDPILPTEVTVDVDDSAYTQEALNEAAVEAATEKYGFCIKSADAAVEIELTEDEFNEHVARFNGKPGETQGVNGEETLAMLRYAIKHNKAADNDLQPWIDAYRDGGYLNS